MSTLEEPDPIIEESEYDEELRLLLQELSELDLYEIDSQRHSPLRHATEAAVLADPLYGRWGN